MKGQVAKNEKKAAGPKVPPQVKWMILLASFSSIGYGYLTTVIGGAMLAAGYFALPFILAAIFYMSAVIALYFNFRNVKVDDERSAQTS
ncbi:MAG: hypothetical protein E4H30_04425 [Methanomassiliicoccus sp.]|nr:MAG: hypothetical protein E4H30_04425 [Methanomassiliicoccus sp.]